MTTTRSIISNFRATPRLFPVPVSSPLRQTEILRLANYHRPISSTSSSSSPSGNSQNQSTNTRSDRLLVLGLLTFTTLIGVGIGTRAKCYQNGTVTSNNESKNSSKTLSQNQSGNSSETKSDNSPETSSETSEQGAFNPETGEINWDCPCLGGMAHGTCGEQFKAAFSCFVHSEQEPKGVECIERFKEMQDCFREHPDEYGPELTDSDDSARDDEPPNSLDEIAPEDQLHVEGQTEERQLAARPLTPEDAPIQNENRTEERQETNEEVVESSKKQAPN